MPSSGCAMRPLNDSSPRRIRIILPIAFSPRCGIAPWAALPRVSIARSSTPFSAWATRSPVGSPTMTAFARRRGRVLASAVGALHRRLLVGREGEHDGDLPRDQVLGGLEHRDDGPLHVGGAASVHPTRGELALREAPVVAHRRGVEVPREDDPALPVLGEKARGGRVPEERVPHVDLVRERLDVVQDLLFVRERVARDLDQLREHVHHLALHRVADLTARRNVPRGNTVAARQDAP